ncbi:phage tail tube protein [bacterium]|nr:phage tail tube protein [bacterium]
MGKVKAGISKLSLNGKVISVKGNVTLTASGDQREVLNGTSGLAGHKVTPVNGMVEGEIFVPDDLDPKDVFDFSGGTVTVELQDGKVFLLADAEYTGERKYETEEATMPISFTGSPGKFV